MEWSLCAHLDSDAYVFIGAPTSQSARKYAPRRSHMLSLPYYLVRSDYLQPVAVSQMPVKSVSYGRLNTFQVGVNSLEHIDTATVLPIQAGRTRDGGQGTCRQAGRQTGSGASKPCSQVLRMGVRVAP